MGRAPQKSSVTVADLGLKSEFYHHPEFGWVIRGEEEMARCKAPEPPPPACIRGASHGDAAVSRASMARNRYAPTPMPDFAPGAPATDATPNATITAQPPSRAAARISAAAVAQAVLKLWPPLSGVTVADLGQKNAFYHHPELGWVMPGEEEKSRLQFADTIAGRAAAASGASAMTTSEAATPMLESDAGSVAPEPSIAANASLTALGEACFKLSPLVVWGVLVIRMGLKGAALGQGMIAS